MRSLIITIIFPDWETFLSYLLKPPGIHDILFIRKENSAIMQDYIRGVPDMVCEIVSKGSVAKGTVTKKEIYERYKVPEYWIVFPELETIEVFTIEGG
ncbi:MAG: Uma2 family endonuclease [Nitrospirae bacterium]|nr:Uma2 family endonuclease [Nitrospirota bacterium]